MKHRAEDFIIFKKQMRVEVEQHSGPWDIIVRESDNLFILIDSRTPRAVSQEAKHSILWLHLDEERGRLLSLGHDRIIKIWDLSPLLKSDL